MTKYARRPMNQKPHLTCGVGIPCHNHAEFLDDAIPSELQHSVPPAKVIVVDDASDDDSTARVAATFPVEYLRVEHRSVWHTRREALARLKTDAVIFLDADDMLGPGYIANGLRVLQQDWRCGVVYPDVHYCGAKNTQRSYREHDRDELERDNYMVAGSMVRRTALELSGAFEAPAPSDGHQAHEDWYLWRLVSRYGYSARRLPNAVYRYRKHAAGNSMHDVRSRTTKWAERAAFHLETVTIACPLAGRWKEWAELMAWLDRQTWPQQQCRLILLDTSQDASFGLEVRRWSAACGYPDVRVIHRAVGDPQLAHVKRVAGNSEEAQQAVCRAWSILTRELSTPWTLTLEDDVIPPDDAIRRLFDAVHHPSVDAVVAPYLNRFRHAYCVYTQGRQPKERGEGITRLDGAGFGCMLVRSHLLRQHVFTHGPKFTDWFDPWFTRANNLHMLCRWDAEARHLPAETCQSDEVTA